MVARFRLGGPVKAGFETPLYVPKGLMQAIVPLLLLCRSRCCCLRFDVLLWVCGWTSDVHVLVSDTSFTHHLLLLGIL